MRDHPSSPAPMYCAAHSVSQLISPPPLPCLQAATGEERPLQVAMAGEGTPLLLVADMAAMARGPPTSVTRPLLAPLCRHQTDISTLPAW